jgi:hypothetical protein
MRGIASFKSRVLRNLGVSGSVVLGELRMHADLRWTLDMSVCVCGACHFRKFFISSLDLIDQSLLLGSPDRPYAPFTFASSKVHQCLTGVTTILFSASSYRSLLTIRAEGSEDDSPARPIHNKALATKNKWEGEDDDDDGPVVSLPTVFLRPFPSSMRSW